VNSKGISPVIATVLLILVAVAVVAVVATWSTSMVGEQTGKAETITKGGPGEARFHVESCSISGDTVTIKLVNDGTKDLNNFTVFCLNSSGNTVATRTLSASMIPQQPYSGTVTCTSATTRVRVKSQEYPNLVSERDCTS
jgi:flagellin-like protein